MRRNCKNVAVDSHHTIDSTRVARSPDKQLRIGVAVSVPALEYVAVVPLSIVPLEYLAARAGELVTRTEIEEHIYDDIVSPMSNVVDSAICNLRKKLTAAGAGDPIRTRRGMGYVLEVSE